MAKFQRSLRPERSGAPCPETPIRDAVTVRVSLGLGAPSSRLALEAGPNRLDADAIPDAQPLGSARLDRRPRSGAIAAWHASPHLVLDARSFSMPGAVIAVGGVVLALVMQDGSRADDPR
jgi:hypothetical protein